MMRCCVRLQKNDRKGSPDRGRGLVNLSPQEQSISLSRSTIVGGLGRWALQDLVRHSTGQTDLEGWSLVLDEDKKGGRRKPLAQDRTLSNRQN